MVGVPGFLARFLTRFLARFLTRVFGQVFWTRKYSVQYYRNAENTVLQLTGTENNLKKNHIIENPILLKIPHIKDLAVAIVCYVLLRFALCFALDSPASGSGPRSAGNYVLARGKAFFET